MKNSNRKPTKSILAISFIILFISIVYIFYAFDRKNSDYFVGVVYKKTATSISVYEIDEFNKDLNPENLKKHKISGLGFKNIPLFFKLSSIKENDVVFITHPSDYVSIDTISSPMPVYDIENIDLVFPLNFENSIRIPLYALSEDIQSIYTNDQRVEETVYAWIWDNYKQNTNNYHFVNLKRFYKDSKKNQYGFYCYFAEYTEKNESLHKLREIKVPVLYEKTNNKVRIQAFTTNDEIRAVFPDEAKALAISSSMYSTLKTTSIVYHKNNIYFTYGKDNEPTSVFNGNMEIEAQTQRIVDEFEKYKNDTDVYAVMYQRLLCTHPSGTYTSSYASVRFVNAHEINTYYVDITDLNTKGNRRIYFDQEDLLTLQDYLLKNGFNKIKD